MFWFDWDFTLMISWLEVLPALHAVAFLLWWRWVVVRLNLLVLHCCWLRLAFSWLWLFGCKVNFVCFPVLFWWLIIFGIISEIYFYFKTFIKLTKIYGKLFPASISILIFKIRTKLSEELVVHYQLNLAYLPRVSKNYWIYWDYPPRHKSIKYY